MCKYLCRAKAVYRKVFLLIAKLQVHSKNSKLLHLGCATDQEAVLSWAFRSSRIL